VAEGDHVTGDIELPASRALDAARPDKQPTAEDKMRTTIVKSVAVSVPLATSIFVGMIALAVRDQHPGWDAGLGMAAGIGVVAGVFFGLLAAFMAYESPFSNDCWIRRVGPLDL
jgi:hypothetical protein